MYDVTGLGFGGDGVTVTAGLAQQHRTDTRAEKIFK